MCLCVHASQIYDPQGLPRATLKLKKKVNLLEEMIVKGESATETCMHHDRLRYLKDPRKVHDIAMSLVKSFITTLFPRAVFSFSCLYTRATYYGLEMFTICICIVCNSRNLDIVMVASKLS